MGEVPLYLPACPTREVLRDAKRAWPCYRHVQGYLAHKTQRPPRTLQ